MKLRHYAFGSIFFSASIALGQWTTTGNNIQNSNTGLVGIGAAAAGPNLLEVTNNGTATSAAIYGNDARTTGVTRGVTGSASSPSGSGVFGTNLATSGSGVGVYGRSFASSGFGIYGFTGSSETAVAGGFQTDRAGGTGVSIRGAAASGSGRALDIIQSSSSGYSLYVTGGRAHIGSNFVGFGTTTPSAQLDVLGTVRLQSQPSATNAVRAVALDSQGNVSTLPIGGIGGVVEFAGAGSTVWTVPSNVTRIRIQLWGGGGGGNSIGSGGAGGYVDASMSVFPGEQWVINRGVAGGGVTGTSAAGAGGLSNIISFFGPSTPVFVASGGSGANSSGGGAGGGTTPTSISGGITRVGFNGNNLPACNPTAYSGPVVALCPTNLTPTNSGWGGIGSISVGGIPQGGPGNAGHAIITW